MESPWSYGEQVINNSGILAVFEDAQEVVADTDPCLAAAAGRADNLRRGLGAFALALYFLLETAQAPPTEATNRTFREHGEDIVGFTLRFGVDMQEGRGVDVVMDLTEGFEQVDKALGRRRFGTIFGLSALEHCREPFKMAENLMRLLKPGGIYPAKENDEKVL